MLAITDTYVNENPSAEEVAEIARMAADELRRFGIEPKRGAAVALQLRQLELGFGAQDAPACEILHETAPDLNVDGEMHGDAALSEEIRDKLHPDSRLKGEANLLVMPNLDAANISFNLMKVANGDGVSVGPILLGAAKPVHIVTPSATVRRLVNMTALAVVDAKESRGGAARRRLRTSLARGGSRGVFPGAVLRGAAPLCFLRSRQAIAMPKTSSPRPLLLAGALALAAPAAWSPPTGCSPPPARRSCRASASRSW
jgi:hypothetical protein